MGGIIMRILHQGIALYAGVVGQRNVRVKVGQQLIVRPGAVHSERSVRTVLSSSSQMAQMFSAFVFIARKQVVAQPPQPVGQVYLEGVRVGDAQVLIPKSFPAQCAR